MLKYHIFQIKKLTVKSQFKWLGLIAVLILFGLSGVGVLNQVQATESSAQPLVQSPASLFGVEMSQISLEGGLEQMDQAGVYYLRRNALMWSQVQPEEGMEIDWSAAAALEEELINAAERDMPVILVVRSTPEWARLVPDKACSSVREDKLAAFAYFMGEAVARYSVPPYNVKFWEIWNEPDVDPSLVSSESLFGCWGDMNDEEYYGGGYYAAALKAVYPAIKVADPQAYVLIGGLLLDCDPNNPPDDPPGSGQPKDCNSSRYLEGILVNDGGDYFDGVSFHAYDFYNFEEGTYNNSNWHSAWNTTGPVISAKTSFIRSVLTEYGVAGKDVWNTETSLFCTEPEVCHLDTDFEFTKAYYVPQSYAQAIELNLWANVWYAAMAGWRDSDLLYSDGSPRLAYFSYQFAQSQLHDAAFVRQVEEYQGVFGYVFHHPDRSMWLLWSGDGEEHTITLPDTPLQAFDAFGNEMSVGPTVQVTLLPIYLEWQPFERIYMPITYKNN